MRQKNNNQLSPRESSVNRSIMEIIVNRIKTRNSNYLVKVEKDNRVYVFYTDNLDKLIKLSNIEDWDWACKEWESLVFRYFINEKIEEIIDSIPDYTEILKTGVSITVKPEGFDELWGLRNQLDEFVDEHFELLWKGACRLKVDIDEDYYAPKRIQIRETRLHKAIGLKYANGHKYNSDYSPTEQNILETVADIQTLIDAASKNVTTKLKLSIKAE